MAKALYYPLADRVTQDFSALAVFDIDPDACLWHSTEGSSWPDYEAGKKAPHLTLLLDFSKPRSCKWRQHFPFNRNSRALVNLEGGVQTNGNHVVQIEIVATSGWASAENPSAPYKVYPKISDLPDWLLREIGRFAAFMHIEWKVPLKQVKPFVAWNAKRPTLTDDEWLHMAGHVGHQHAPENTHTDPGELDMPRIIWHAQQFLTEWDAHGYPWESLTPPEPPPVVKPPVVEPPAPEPPVVPPPVTPPPAPAPAKDVIGEILREGDKGKAVSAAQLRLAAHGFPEPKSGIPDGSFGSRMTLQVKAFQSAKGLEPDGVIGKMTWGALQEKGAAEMRAETLAILYAYGWKGAPSHTQAIRDFQAAWNFGTAALVVDGVPGAKTYAAALEMKRLGGKISPNFKASEFQCRCGDRYDDCRRVWVKRSLLAALEKLRARYYPSGLRVVSGCRCPKHNSSIPGAYEHSQHTKGRGCDVEPKLTPAQVRSLGVLSGIGYARASGLVVHVDVRADPGPDRYNSPSGTNTAPRIFAEG